MLRIRIPNNLSGQGGKTDSPARITKAGSKQTYYTFRLLADRDRVQDAFRSYAYFRWLDDLLDCNSGTQQEKVALLKRQQALLQACYQRQLFSDVSPEEQMLVDLVNNDEEKHSGLQIYLRNMMAVLSFDVERCGRVISQTELTEYSHLLSSAVTEALLYFIGHQDPPPCSGTRYHAACGAHVAHMLRDMVEDISAGYYNIPSEYISAQQISFDELHSLSIRKWVFSRVMLARRYFKLGRDYISQVKSLRCRLAGFAYLARFEWVLRMIERDGYCLRPEYHERKSLRASLWVAWRTFSLLINMPWIRLEPGPQAPLPDQCEDK